MNTHKIASRLSSLALISLTLFGTVGCVSPTSVEITDEQRQQYVQNAALFIKATAANGVIVAVNEAPESKYYASAVREALAKVICGSDYTPQKFEEALTSIPVKPLNSKYAPMIAANVGLAYEFYYGQAVRDAVNENQVATVLIQAAIDGIDLGLAGKAPSALSRPMGLKSR